MLESNTVSVNFIIVPGSLVSVDAATFDMGALAGATKELWDVCFIQVLLNSGHIVRTNDLDFATSLLIEEALDNGPDSAKEHGGIDHEHVSHDFGVIVGADLCCQLAKPVGLRVSSTHAAASHVHNCEALDHAFSLECRTGRELKFHQFLVLHDVVSNHALIGRKFEEGWHIKHTEALVVHWATLLVDSVVTMGVNFHHTLSLWEVVRFNDGIDAILVTPIHEVLEHNLNFGEVKLSCSTEAKKVVVVEVQLF